MRLYALLDRILPRSYVAKAVAVAVLFGQGPFLLLVLAKVSGWIPPDLSVAALGITMAAAFLALALGLAAVIKPVSRLEAAFMAFEAGGGLPAALPEHHRDAVGRLMAQANRLMRTAETRIDAAERLADRDPLTGLLNRRGLERSLARRHSAGQRGAVIMMDLDHFKRVNDVHGHDVGDRALRDLAAIVRRQMRKPDLAARFGGEEFVVYLSELGQDAALRVAERLRMSVEDNLKVDGQAQTVSIGVAPWPPGESFAAILKRADMAVYAAKAAGRNRVHLVPAARTVGAPGAVSLHADRAGDPATDATVPAGGMPSDPRDETLAGSPAEPRAPGSSPDGKRAGSEASSTPGQVRVRSTPDTARGMSPSPGDAAPVMPGHMAAAGSHRDRCRQAPRGAA